MRSIDVSKELLALDQRDSELKDRYWSNKTEIARIEADIGAGTTSNALMLRLMSKRQKALDLDLRCRQDATRLAATRRELNELLTTLQTREELEAEAEAARAEERAVQREAAEAARLERLRERRSKRAAMKRFWATFVTDAMAADQYAMDEENRGA